MNRTCSHEDEHHICGINNWTQHNNLYSLYATISGNDIITFKSKSLLFTFAINENIHKKVSYKKDDCGINLKNFTS